MKNASSSKLSGASFQQASGNRKLSRVGSEDYLHQKSGRTFHRPIPKAPFVSTTNVSIRATCPDSCVFKEGACYQQAGITGIASRKLDDAAKELSGDDVIAHEVMLIDAQWPAGVPQDGPDGKGRPLRLHVGGDVSSPEAARELALAAFRWLKRGGGPVWTYTHRWKDIPAGAWGLINVWASCETIAQVREAKALGYRTAITINSFSFDRKYILNGELLIPCPEQTRGRTCLECRLCLDRSHLHEATIAFAIHGKREHKVSLPTVQ